MLEVVWLLVLPLLCGHYNVIGGLPECNVSNSDLVCATRIFWGVRMHYCVGYLCGLTYEATHYAIHLQCLVY